MSSGPGSWFFFSGRYFQSCVVDELGHVTVYLVAGLNMYLCTYIDRELTMTATSQL